MPPPYNPPPPPPAYSWTGFYIGGNGGFGGDQFEYPFTVGAIPALGFGGRPARRRSIRVVSLAAARSATIGNSRRPGLPASKPSSTAPISKARRRRRRIRFPAMSAARWTGSAPCAPGSALVTPTALLYATGGWDLRPHHELGQCLGARIVGARSTGDTQNGWTAGGGIEYAFNPWLSMKTEYLYLDSAPTRSPAARSRPNRFAQRKNHRSHRQGRF